MPFRQHHSIIIGIIGIIVTFLIFIVTAETTPFSSSTKISTSPPTIYDILQTHGLPTGIFPKGISDFSIDPSSGRFEFHLAIPSPCDAKFETSVRYDWNVSGLIGLGKVSDLKGVAAQELFLWLPVMGIHVDVPSSGLIYFDAGVVSKQFSLSFFDTPRDCNFVADSFEASDLSFLRHGGPIIQNPSEENVKEHHPGQKWRAVS